MTYIPVLDRDNAAVLGAMRLFVSGGNIGAIPYLENRDVSVTVDRSRREISSQWFTLARVVPLKVRRARGDRSARRPLILLNGDEAPRGGGWGSSNRAADNQRYSRDAARELEADTVVIPFSALNGAGIELDSVRIVDARPDEEWTETVTVRSLAELPRWERVTRYSREHESPNLEDVPESHGRKVWRLPAAEELALGLADTRGTMVSGQSAYLPRLPDADGLYRWETWHERPRVAGADGLFRYSRRVHRLGDSLISATRNGRRARFLSSFDTNEAPPLYFLAQVPRGAGDTVSMAIDSLAPRAVHAAAARGVEVKRQGDIFFVDTQLSRRQLEARGATFARLTQWTRDARARKGEVNYRRPQTAAEHRREIRYARQVWRERYADTIARAGAVADRAGGREATRARFQDLRVKHELERLTAYAAGVPLDSALSTSCDSCGAAVGVECSPIESASESLNARIEYERQRTGFHRPRVTLEARHRTELSTLRHESRASGRRYNGAPVSAKGARRRARRDVLQATARVDDAAAKLRRALAAPYTCKRSTRKRYGWEPGPVLEARQEYARRVTGARRALNYAQRDLASTIGARARARDDYRSSLGSGGTVALVLWREARQTAAARFRPDDFASDRISARRERARRALAVYGTAHSATEVARVTGGAVYVRGVVVHRPDLEPGRRGDPDHRPVTLAPDRWYLAIRNTVPRQDTRGARRA